MSKKSKVNRVIVREDTYNLQNETLLSEYFDEIKEIYKYYNVVDVSVLLEHLKTLSCKKTFTFYSQDKNSKSEQHIFISNDFFIAVHSESSINIEPDFDLDNPDVYLDESDYDYIPDSGYFYNKVFFHYPKPYTKHKELTSLFKCQSASVDKVGKVNIIAAGDDGKFSLNQVPTVLDSIAYENYSTGFEQKAAKLIEALKTKTKGIALLHGAPGTGKSTFLKVLPNLVKQKTFIFIPPMMVHVLSTPGFMTFMQRYPKSVLIIEDAETVLESREGTGNEIVSNILNFTDGILSDLLGIQVICTLNCNINLIDKAVRRPGRLVFEHSFEKLSIEHSNERLKTLFPDKNYTTNKPLTISEIYNFEYCLENPEPEKHKIGF